MKFAKCLIEGIAKKTDISKFFDVSLDGEYSCKGCPATFDTIEEAISHLLEEGEL